MSEQADLDDGPQSSTSNIVFGRYMLPDQSEHPCQVIDISHDGASFLTPNVPAQGLMIVAYIEDLGRVEAVTTEAVEGGMRIAFTATGARRERLNSRINWLKQRDAGMAEGRRHARYEPREKNSQITLPDGRVYQCEVTDISISGAAIKTDIMPTNGTYVMLGRMKGKVVRYVDTGIAVEFVKQLDTGQIPDTAPVT